MERKPRSFTESFCVFRSGSKKHVLLSDFVLVLSIFLLQARQRLSLTCRLSPRNIKTEQIIRGHYARLFVSCFPLSAEKLNIHDKKNIYIYISISFERSLRNVKSSLPCARENWRIDALVLFHCYLRFFFKSNSSMSFLFLCLRLCLCLSLRRPSLRVGFLRLCLRFCLSVLASYV